MPINTNKCYLLRTKNPCVGGSIPPLATNKNNDLNNKDKKIPELYRGYFTDCSLRLNSSIPVSLRFCANRNAYRFLMPHLIYCKNSQRCLQYPGKYYK